MTENKKLDKFEKLKKQERKKVLKDAGWTEEGAEIEATHNDTLHLCWHKQQRIIEESLKNGYDIGEEEYTDTRTNKQMYKDKQDGKIKEKPNQTEEPTTPEEPKEKPNQTEEPTTPEEPKEKKKVLLESLNVSDSE